ncbi:hypothetical protein Sxan_34720 [Streptomyces xanthophaeus]|uniref:RNA polymerase sigma factor n=1 Tax=Streptomyces xanthophaeus TaxID=67385 RepID=A0A919H3P7_9ACTN|nr:hypothetical protein Sxan_34720 [Streptomyces xanthophaeus]
MPFAVPFDRSPTGPAAHRTTRGLGRNGRAGRFPVRSVQVRVDASPTPTDNPAPRKEPLVPLSPTLRRTDPEALAELQRDHGRALFGFLLGLTAGDAQRAEDLVQETLVRVWQHPEVLASAHDSMRPWLFTVARRLAIDARRARLSRPQEVDPEGLEQAPAPEDAVAGSVTAIDVRRAVGSLGPEHREVLLQVYFRDRSVAEAAAELGIPAGTVKSRTYYALRALRKDLQGYGYGLGA